MIDDGYPVVELFTAQPGMRVGKLVLISKEKISGRTYWDCQCDCGKIKKIRQDNLSAGARGIKGGTRSCGCKQATMFVNPNTGLKYEDLTGQILNGWKLIKKTNMTDSNRSIMYLCQSVIKPEYFDLLSIRHLKDGHVAQARIAKKSYEDTQKYFYEPKMTLSGPERKCLDILKENSIKGIFQAKLEGCKDKLYLPFDFLITSSTPNYVIEIDGEQHFKSIECWGGEERYNIIRAHDLMKNKFCFDNKVPLIRIPDKANYTINDLKPETSRFLLTPENEEKYYGIYT